MHDSSKPTQADTTSSVPQQPVEIVHASTLNHLAHGANASPAPPQRPKRRLWLVIVILAMIGIGAWIALREHNARAAASRKPQAPPPTPVVATLAHQGDIPVYFTGLGAVTSLYTVNTKTRVDGQIMKVNYAEGQRVSKGQPLVEIDPRPFEVQLTQAQGQLIRDQATLANAKVDLERYQTLIAKNAVAQQVYATQKAIVAQNEGNVKTDEGNIASAKLNIAYSHITASISGRAGLRLVDPGNLVTAASATPLVVITQTQPISVIFTLPEEQVPAVLKQVHGGHHLKVDALDRDSQETLAQGELATLDNQIDQTTGTLRFRAVFPNKDDVLFPNQFVNARLLVQEKRNVTLVSNAAIQRNGTATFVYVVQPNNTVALRNVQVGADGAQESEVLSGLTQGEEVVIQGVDKLQEGSHVQAHVQQPGAPAANTQAGNSSPAQNSNASSGTTGGRGNQKTRASSQTGAGSNP